MREDVIQFILDETKAGRSDGLVQVVLSRFPDSDPEHLADCFRETSRRLECEAAELQVLANRKAAEDRGWTVHDSAKPE